MSAADVEEKFRVNAAVVLPPDRIERVIAAVRNVESASSLRDLIGHCLQ
jgi:hypothetical protein